MVRGAAGALMESVAATNPNPNPNPNPNLDGERGRDVLGRTQRYAQLRSRLLLVHHEGLAIEEPLSEGGRGLDAG